MREYKLMSFGDLPKIKKFKSLWHFEIFIIHVDPCYNFQRANPPTVFSKSQPNFLEVMVIMRE